MSSSALSQDPTHQYAMTVVVPVNEEHVEALRTLLSTISGETADVMKGKKTTMCRVPFHEVESLHYGRFVLFDESPEHGDPALLVLSTNFDGPIGESRRHLKRARSAHISDLVTNAYVGLDEVFGHCQGYESGAGDGALTEYISRHQIRAQTFYTASSGRSRGQILEELKLRIAIESAADRVSERHPRPTSPGRVRAAIIEELEKTTTIPPPFPAQPNGGLALIGIGFLLVMLVVGISVVALPWLLDKVAGGALGLSVPYWWGFPIFLGIVVLLFIYLRIRETLDPSDTPRHDAATRAHTELVSEVENDFMQNQLTNIVDLKPGWFRLSLITGVFFALQVLATYLFNKGKLGNIPSIHFARWVFLGKKRRVLFLSNFDNSWQSYLGDFVDQASTGLTAVWSNTKGYPPTKYLVRAGSRNSTSFLAWVRKNQRPTNVWYSAYPALSIKNLNDNTLLRRGIADPSCMPAADWLRALAGEDLDPQKPPEKPDQPPQPADLDMDDIQGIILKGYGFLEHATFMMLRVRGDADASKARRWIGAIANDVTSESRGSKDHYRHLSDAEKADIVFLNVAFTYRGLRKLGLDEKLLGGFPPDFHQGSHHRSRSKSLGDVGESAPERWDWGNEDNPVDILLMTYCYTAEQAAKERARRQAEAESSGLTVVAVLDGDKLPGRKEHFGFRDGIAQPALRDDPLTSAKNCSEKRRQRSPFNELAAGEFLLGYGNGYRTPNDTGDANVAFAPETEDGFEFSRGGSYLVFRQLEQRVADFWSYCDRAGSSPGVEMPAETVASKMVGRWPNGEPLVLHPDGPSCSDPSNEDKFGYLNNGDPHGHKCPFGAHIRRSNPRDWLLGDNPIESMRLANLHRIIRKGRPYGPPFVPDMDIEKVIARAKSGVADAESRGLNFICFNANIERQFEFVQQQWVNNPQMTMLMADADPVMGLQHRPEAGIGADTARFTIQKEPLRGRCHGIDQFVHVRGSSYFFMPPISAVEYIGGL